MSTAKSNHYLTDEPRVFLSISEDPFTLFYDYDQIRDRKLSRLSPEQKVVWFRARTNMIFLEPLRRLWNSSSHVFNELMRTSPTQQVNCSFSIAAMSVMLNGVEALGSFIAPDLKGRGKSKDRFFAFLRPYMSNWLVNVRISGRNWNVANMLWKHFRNGIAHGFGIEGPGSLEFLQDRPFQVNGPVLHICPRHFFSDLDRAVTAYFASFKESSEALQRFHKHFDKVYPN